MTHIGYGKVMKWVLFSVARISYHKTKPKSSIHN